MKVFTVLLAKISVKMLIYYQKQEKKFQLKVNILYCLKYNVGSLAELHISCLGIFYHITGNKSIVNKPNAASLYLSKVL